MVFFRGCLWSVSCMSGSVHSVWREYSSCWPKWNFSSLWLFHHPWPAEASFCIVQYPVAWEIDGQFLDRHLDLFRVLVIDLDQGWMGSSWLSCRHTAGKFNFWALEACAQLGVLVIILLLLRKTEAPCFRGLVFSYSNQVFNITDCNCWHGYWVFMVPRHSVCLGRLFSIPCRQIGNNTIH